MKIATFNLENFDNKPGQEPTLKQRIDVMRPQLERLDADILCLQEINGQETPGQPRDLLALKELIRGTRYEGYNLVTIKKLDGSEVYDERNLAILSSFEITEHEQFKNKHIDAPQYKKLTASPEEPVAREVEWERPILYAKIKFSDNVFIHVLNLHLKSKIPTNIPGQKINNYTWRTASSWAEGFFISSMKRVGQALETRVLVDKIHNEILHDESMAFAIDKKYPESDHAPIIASFDM